MRIVAYYVTCTAHSLNLVRKCETERCPAAIRFFIVFVPGLLHLPIDNRYTEMTTSEVRNCMGQYRLRLTSLMSIENDILESLEFNDLISRVAFKNLANIA